MVFAPMDRFRAGDDHMTMIKYLLKMEYLILNFKAV